MRFSRGKTKAFLIAIAAISIMAMVNSCSSHAHVQKEESISLSSYKTFMWVDTKSSENDQSEKNTAHADLSIHSAVNDELKKLGWREVKENPDVLMSYDMLVEGDYLAAETVYSKTLTRYCYNPYTKKWSTINYPSQFQGYQVYEAPVKESTITITMLDAKTDQYILQGWTTEKLSEQGITEMEIRRGVRNIFKELS